MTFSIAQVVVKTDPVLAYRLAPYDGRIGAAYAAILAGPEANGPDRARSDVLAREALGRDATAVVAASTLGLNGQVHGNAATERHFFNYAQTLSRRDFQTQLWAIEDAVARDDVKGALSHYDIAMRTTARGGDLFFPILAKASADPGIRKELIRFLAIKPPWGEGFISYIAGSGLDQRPVALLYTGLRRAGVDIPPQANADVIEGLVKGGFADEAWLYYASIRQHIDRRRSRDSRFSGTVVAPTLFDWTPVNQDGVSASILKGDGGGLLDFAVATSAAGPILKQMQMLPAGSYRLTGHSIGIKNTADAPPYWSLSCAIDGREIGRIDMADSDIGGGTFTGILAVPSGCEIQMLALIARPSDTIGGLSGQIDRLEVVPLR